MKYPVIVPLRIDMEEVHSGFTVPIHQIAIRDRFNFFLNKTVIEVRDSFAIAFERFGKKGADLIMPLGQVAPLVPQGEKSKAPSPFRNRHVFEP